MGQADMSQGPEPRFARVAAVIGDPTRARMLSLLLGNPHATAGEIARAARVTPQTASAHLAKMMQADLIAVRRRGRHRFFLLANDEVAHALEALSVVAERTSAGGLSSAWSRETFRPLREARSCYGHLAGRLGVVLHDQLMARHHLALEDSAYRLTAQGSKMLEALGLDSGRREGEVVAYPCLDWSERRDHFAGPLPVALLRHFLAKRWLRRLGASRALIPTPTGRRALGELLGLAS
jgi:DNA-binding transcriptional ArsR family regulator